MKYIPLTRGQLAIVDDEDYRYLSQYKWFAKKCNKTFYACRGKRQGELYGADIISMNREIMDVLNQPKILVNFKDYNGLNNQKSNLRLCNKSQVVAYKRKNPNGQASSKYHGVYLLDRMKGKYRERSYIASVMNTQTGKYERIGGFKSEIAAAKAYDEEAKKYHGEFASLNFR